MKKLLCLLLCSVMIFMTVIPAFSAQSQSECREYFEDGSYIVTVTTNSLKNEFELGIFSRILEFFRKIVEFFKSQKSISRTKYLNYYSSDDVLLWTAMLEADFIYSKTSASCTSSEFSIDIYDADWELLSFSCDKKENTATAQFFVKQTKLLVPLKTIEKTMTLSCDTKGNVK